MKKIIVLMCMFLPFGVFSQEAKIAVVNAAEIFNMMPELDDVDNQLAILSTQYQNDLQSMQADLTAKNDEYIKIQETLPENLKLRRQEEMQQIYERIQNLYTVAQQDIEQKRIELMEPIEEKITKAIQEVGAEQGYTFIMNNQMMLYVSPSAIDATQLVKTKLGLR